jgi:sortase (surface protein transpeptidase)
VRKPSGGPALRLLSRRIPAGERAARFTRSGEAAVLAGLVVAGVGGSAAPAVTGAATVVPSAATTRAAATAPSTSAAGVGAFRSVRTYQGVALPQRLRIPAIGVDTAIEGVGLAADGTIAPPSGWHVTGWYDRGPRPGQAGPAVIVGHVDSRSGPAVFYRLAQLRPGDVVHVDRADRTTARFRVVEQRQVPKDQFPVELYAPTLQSSLRLLTCGGSFDDRTGHYRDNLIVSAVPG